jgi:transposase
MHARRGKQPYIMSSPTKEKVAFFGLVNPSTGELFAKEDCRFNSETFILAIIDFLKKHKSKKKIYVILDNASWHKKGVRLITEIEELKEIKDCIQFIFLPPYSPDLNPIERVWRITRHDKTHNKYFKSLNILIETLHTFFDSMSVPNLKLKSLCTI